MAEPTALRFTEKQSRIALLGSEGKLFAEGAAATGKTTAAVAHVAQLLASRVSAYDITIIVPQPLLGRPYREFEMAQREFAGAGLRVTTYGSIARRAVELFWPVVSEAIGHQIVRAAPVFLNTEAAQMHLRRVIDPLIDQKLLFESTLRLPRRRIYTQILDNINKSALVGFPVDEIGARLTSAWVGQDEQARMYDDVQTCATVFRKYCLERGLLDYSLAVDVFRQFVWPLDSCRTWLTQTARHVVYDNCEEDSPAAHDLLLDLIDESDSALVLFDQDASYRRFLGADEKSAARLQAVCDESIVLDESVSGSDKETLVAAFGVTFGYGEDAAPSEDPLRHADVRGFRYFPDMMDSICGEIARLTEEEGVDAGQIAIVTPYLSDALRFALINRLERRNIPVRSLRPSRPLGGEPAARCLLLLSQLAHPAWGAQINAQDIAQALSLAINDLDPVRAFLLASTYRPATGLASFGSLSESLRLRITDELGARYERLRLWLLTYLEGEARHFDYFLALFYNDLLVQEGFRFHQALEAGNTAAALVRSAREFRRLAEELGEEFDAASYVQLVLEGQIGEQALSRPDDPDLQGGVQVAPAYTFLMHNRAVAYQFWLDLGSSGWSERLHQPLGQPFVLSRNWPEGRLWTATDDAVFNAQFAYRLIAGLLRRCTGRVWLAHVDYNEQGFTQQGALLIALQRILRRRNAIGQGS